MTYLYRTMLIASLPIVVLSVAGCSANNPRKAAQRIQTTNDLRQVGLAFHEFADLNPGKAPAKAEDLQPFLKESAEVYAKLSNGDFVFLYNVPLQAMTDGAGSSNTVLAYEKDTPAQGGLVLLGDGTVKRMTAEEFQAAPKATARDKR